MKAIYLSRVDQLAEWFMLLFFDPMYFYSQTKEESSDKPLTEMINNSLEKLLEKSHVQKERVGKYVKPTIDLLRERFRQSVLYTAKVIKSLGVFLTRSWHDLMIRSKKSTFTALEKVLYDLFEDRLIFK